LLGAGKNDAWNGVYGGLAAGAVLGLRARRITFGVGSGVALAAASVVCDITGGHLTGKPLVRSPRPPLIRPYGGKVPARRAAGRWQR